tara:strand:- start:158190 stop:158504 length:315 start_codon:yes stop_codon:yes gene_type:complete
MFTRRFFRTAGVMCLALIALASCRPEEHGRPLDYDPGVFPGNKHATPLNEDDLAALRQRAILQGGSSVSGPTSGGGLSTGGDVRLPDSPADKALDERLKKQSGN